MAELKPFKITFRIGIDPRLEFYKRLFDGALSLDGYPDWQTNGLEVNLINEEDHFSTKIAYDRIQYTQDNIHLDLANNNIKKILTRVPSSLGLEEVSGIGYKVAFLKGVKMSYRDIVNILDVALLDNTFYSKTFDEDVKDVSVTTDIEINEVLYSIKIGPIRKNDIYTFREPDKTNFNNETMDTDIKELLSKFEDRSVFIEVQAIDKNNTDVNDVVKSIEEISGTVESLAIDIASNLFD